MAELLIDLLLEQLATVSFDYTIESVTVVLTAETEVEESRRNLRAIQAVLADAERRQMEEAIVRRWLHDLEDVCYEMVDVLDEWKTEILKVEVKGVATDETKKSFKKVCFYIPSNCFCFGQVNKATRRHKIASEIKELNVKLALIAAEGQKFNFLQSSIRSIVDERLERPKTTSFIDVFMIFGREEETADLLSKLFSDGSEEGEKVIVIPIVGMGGMGKTTLAQLAYNSEKVRAYFDERIWVCVSDPFDEVMIAKAIIEHDRNEVPNSNELETLQHFMSRSLEGKKYLIVLDDVWTEDQRKWERLRLPIIMQNCAKGSRLLVTTRSEGVAEMMRATTHMIHLGKLSDEDCLALFNRIVYFDREEDEATGFGAIGEKIAKKCDGLPLAARALGRFILFSKTRRVWQDVLNSEIWEIEEVEQEVFRPLLLSYYDLAPIAKNCLLYCVIFPKDYRFNKHNLIELWMSQNYFSGSGHKEMEEKGQYVFDSLVMRSFFQEVVEEVSSYDKSITIFCKMHDIMHDFVQYLNHNKCFTADLKEANTRMMITSEVHHLSLMHAPYGSPLSDFISQVNCKKLRTLATFDSRMTNIDGKAISQLKCLRTLNLSRNDIGELPEEIDELIHLRYLDLSENTDLEKLPDSLCNLYNLQTLCLTKCGSLRTLPENMGNLVNLRHLHNKGCYQLEYLPRGIARLTILQTLNRCPVIHDSGPGEALKLGDLGSLDQFQGSLNIYIKGNLKDTSEALKARLWNKKLHNLKICFKTLEEQSHVQVLEALRPHQDLQILQISWYSGTTTPSWMISLQNLRSLSLELCVRWEFLPPLGKLPLLEQLSVSGMDKVQTVGDEFLGITGTRTSSSSALFPRLKDLSFEIMSEWEQWKGVGGWTESGSDEITIMPCLVSFRIEDCPKLMNLPLFLQKTPVRRISIRECRRSIITPVWPENCDVNIFEEIEDTVIPDVTRRVETEIQRESQRDEITMIT